MQIRAKFASVCAKCGKPIEAGSLIEWEKGKPAVHTSCPKTEVEAIIETCHGSIPHLLLRAAGARKRVSEHLADVRTQEATTHKETCHHGWILSAKTGAEKQVAIHSALIAEVRRLRGA